MWTKNGTKQMFVINLEGFCDAEIVSMFFITNWKSNVPVYIKICFLDSKHYKKRRKKVHQTTNTKISSMHTSRQQQNTFQQKLKLNIESHGKL